MDSDRLQEMLDAELGRVNDDYPVERQHALKHMFVEVLPNHIFLDYLEYMGKVGGQSKFPRVMKGDKYRDWVKWLGEKGYQVRQLDTP